MANEAVSSATAEVAAEHQVHRSAPYRAVHHGDDGRGEGADGADQPFQRIVVAQRVPAPRAEATDVMASGPDVHSRRGTEHDRAHLPGPQALERGDDSCSHLGTDGVVLRAVLEGDDADLADHASQDDIAGTALGPGASSG